MTISQIESLLNSGVGGLLPGQRQQAILAAVAQAKACVCDELEPPPPPPGQYAVYWGRSASSILDADGILALSTTNRSSSAGSYTFSLDGTAKYLYFAFPHDVTNFAAPADFTLDGLSMAGDFAGQEDGYTNGPSSFPYAIVLIDTVQYRLYRTLNMLDAVATITVQVTT